MEEGGSPLVENVKGLAFLRFRIWGLGFGVWGLVLSGHPYSEASEAVNVAAVYTGQALHDDGRPKAVRLFGLIHAHNCKQRSLSGRGLHIMGSSDVTIDTCSTCS